VKFEELQWPPRFNPAILLQYDGDSDPREFLLKYEAAVEATGGGAACKVKALVLSLRGHLAAISVGAAASLTPHVASPKSRSRHGMLVGAFRRAP